MNKTAAAQQSQSTTDHLSQAKGHGTLQRKCGCGSHTPAGGECSACTAKKKIGLQRKLKIGASNDPLEREADRVADQVMAMPLNSNINTSPPHIQRFSGQASDGLTTAPASVDRVLASSGRSLEPVLRQDMESRFGYDFSQVRVHTGGAAEQSARDVNAQAYTVGDKVVFGEGRFAPGSHEGRRLIAHELTHVLQQSGEATYLMQPDSFQSKIPTTFPNSSFVQRTVFGQSVKFDSLPGSPPRASLLAPYRESAIAEALYGDPTIPVTFVTDLTIEIDYDRLLPQWRPYFDEPVVENETAERNSWPFPGFSASERRQYIDEKTTAVAVNLVAGRVFLTVDGLEQFVEVPLRWFSRNDLDIVPLVPIRNSRTEAIADESQYEFLREQSGLTPVMFYSDSNGLIWPTIVNPQTAPRIMSVYPRALEAARRDVIATRDAFAHLLLWYVGARFPVRTRTSGTTVAGSEAAAAEGAAVAETVFSAARVTDELIVATQSIAGNGQKMLAAARQLSAMGNLTAVQKAEVILTFFRHIGFGVQYTRGAAYVDEGAHLLMTSEDGLFAFQFIKSTGAIKYGRLSRETFQFVWRDL